MIKIVQEADGILNSTGKVLEMVPDLYDDLAKETVKETGSLLSLIPKAIKAVLAPLRKYIIHNEYNIAETEKILAQKLENISPDKIVPPEPYIAVPALEAISYSMDNAELRNLYANLLANSMNIDTKEKVHPSFVEIIKQLTPLEAKLLKMFIDTGRSTFAIVKIKLINSETDHRGVDFVRHIIDPHFNMNVLNHKEYCIALENLQRLQLIHIDYDAFLIDDSNYSKIESGDIFNNCKENAKYQHSCHKFFYPHKGMINITYLGTEFYNICGN